METDLDPTLAYTALLNEGALRGLTVEQGQALRTEMLAAYHAQDEIGSIYAFTRMWLKQRAT
jgi:hypothetical protein